MILGNCDYYQSFVDTANVRMVNFFGLISIFFVILASVNKSFERGVGMPVKHHYSFAIT